MITKERAKEVIRACRSLIKSYNISYTGKSFAKNKIIKMQKELRNFA